MLHVVLANKHSSIQVDLLDLTENITSCLHKIIEVLLFILMFVGAGS